MTGLYDKYQVPQHQAAVATLRALHNDTHCHALNRDSNPELYDSQSNTVTPTPRRSVASQSYSPQMTLQPISGTIIIFNSRRYSWPGRPEY